MPWRYLFIHVFLSDYVFISTSAFLRKQRGRQVKSFTSQEISYFFPNLEWVGEKTWNTTPNMSYDPSELVLFFLFKPPLTYDYILNPVFHCKYLIDKVSVPICKLL